MTSADQDSAPSDVNVGGPDGDPPEYTIGTVTLPYLGDEARRWLWIELDEVRRRYLYLYDGYPDA